MQKKKHCDWCKKLILYLCKRSTVTGGKTALHLCERPAVIGAKLLYWQYTQAV